MPKEDDNDFSKPAEINVYPLGKGRRVLLFLADFFICFILALGLFNIAVYPLGGLALGMEGKYNSYVSSSQARDGVLYGNSLLYHEEGAGDRELTADLEYSCELYTSFYVLDGASSAYEVFSTYYVGIRDDVDAYISFYQGLDEGHGFFEIGPSSVTLKDDYVLAFSALFDPDDTMSDANKALYETFQSQIFLKGYDLMIADIMEKDLAYEGVSYVAEQSKVSDYLNTTSVLTVACVYISYLLAALLDYVLCPLVTKNRKTLAMLMLRRERVNASKLTLFRKPHVPLWAFYNFCFSLGGALFVPMTVVSFNELFSLPSLFAISLLSAGLCLISLFFILFDSYNRSLVDRLTFSVMLDQDSLDDIYRAKGYKIV